MSLSSLAVLSTGALATAAYVNAKFGVGQDLKELRYEKNYQDRIGQLIQKLGDTCSFYQIFENVDPAVESLWFEGRTWTNGELKYEINRLAVYLKEQGVVANDFIGVFASNSPEMVITILALSKLGAIAALINTNLRDDTLTYCLNVSTARMIISTPDLSEFVISDLPHFSLNLFAFPSITSLSNSSAILITPATLPANPPSLRPAPRLPTDLAVLIYTSGTTGRPKACAIRNFMICVTATSHTQDFLHPTKYFPLRTYSALPLFHGTCLFTGLSYTTGASGTFCLARKFSSRNFWKDVHDSRATRVLYVGELCRYLLHSEASEYDKKHNCIVANGNGLRGDVWEKFKTRFGVPEVREFYRSTEGLGKFDNFGSGVWGAGKLGFVGPIRRRMEKDTFIIRFDDVTEMPYRDPATGFCVRCRLNEPGEVVGRVKDRGALTEYLGNRQATEEKLFTDVFEKGDMFQRMGDLVVQDSDGWVHFHDRIGDTFRWKGENVSAGEVRDHIAALPDVEDAVVYGVKLEGYDGKAGAAAITLESHHDAKFMKDLYKALRKTGVPIYAIPRLVRITKEIDTGVTFKQAKGTFLKKSWIEGDNGDRDVLYWLNGQRYERLDGDSWRAIETGKAKL